MDTLREITRQYIESEKEHGTESYLYHYNCAEVLLNACSDYYNLGVDTKTLKAIAPFGGGMASERTCGILTGGIAALGLMFAEEKPTTNAKLKEITNRWVIAFDEEFGNINCKELKEVHRHPESGCKTFMLEASDLLESIIKEYQWL